VKTRIAAGVIAAGILVASSGLGPIDPAGAQTPPPTVGVDCQVNGQPCFTSEQQAQVDRLVAEFVQRRGAAGGPVYEALEGIVRYWVNYAVELGYAIAYSFLPG